MTLQVEGTNDSSCLSKCSAAKKEYFHDDFLSIFVTKCPKRAPLIHLGYSVRASVINMLIEEFVNVDANFKQIVSLGAGFDTLFFKLKSKTPNINVVYYELDLPRVIKKKILCIKQSDVLNQVIGEYTECENGLLGKNYKLLSTDLRDITALGNLFQKYGLDRNIPTLFLSECAITYLEEDRSSELIIFASGFEHATFVTYEQINPDDGFGLVMLQHFTSIQSPLLSVAHHPTLAHQKQRYIKHNWKYCTSISALDAYNNIVSLEERSRVLLLEPFDEWEEFYLKCVHYAVVIASQGSLSKWSKLCHISGLPREVTTKNDLNWEIVETKGVSRYGHSVIQYEDRLLLIGGFGIRKDGIHGRMKDIVWLKLEGSDWKVDQETEASDYATMYSSWTAVSDGSYIVYGGRTAPTHCAFEQPIIVTLQPNGGITSALLVKSCNVQSRWRHTALVVKWNSIETFLVFGGRTSNLELLKDTLMIPLHPDPSERRVVVLPPVTEEPCARFSHSAAVRHKDSGNDEVWVCGGLGSSGPLADVWCLDLATLLWMELPVVGLLPRFSHSASVLQSYLVVVGGVNSLDTCQPAVAVVNLITGICVEYSLPAMSPGKSMILVNHCHILTDENQTLWIVGGGGNCFSFGTFFNSHFAAIRLNDLKM